MFKTEKNFTLLNYQVKYFDKYDSKEKKDLVPKNDGACYVKK